MFFLTGRAKVRGYYRLFITVIFIQALLFCAAAARAADGRHYEASAC